ncbi:MAG: MBL fold metallo-hydrolase [Methanobrevibacter sp.]|nr:MBL fold metallo-hydrolase [Candidatus Methanovirga basalitermitum]
MGLSKKRTEILLNKIGKDLRDIKAIFISHEHVDHIRDIGVINRYYDTLIYGNKDTLNCDNFKKTVGIINPDSLNFIDISKIDISKFVKLS